MNPFGKKLSVYLQKNRGNRRENCMKLRRNGAQVQLINYVSC